MPLPSLPASCPAADSGLPLLDYFYEVFPRQCAALAGLRSICDLAPDERASLLSSVTTGNATDAAAAVNVELNSTRSWCNLELSQLSDYVIDELNCPYNLTAQGVALANTVGSAVCERSCCGALEPPPLPPLPPMPPSLPNLCPEMDTGFVNFSAVDRELCGSFVT
eukprot:5259216-Pleurochrysis_carterae.AAC.1